MDKSTIEKEEYIIREIAQGIYTRWRIKKPSKVQKFLDFLDGRNTANDNDSEMKLETPTTVIEASTFRHKFNLHLIQIKETNEKKKVNRSFDLEEHTTSSFADELWNVWSSAVLD